VEEQDDMKHKLRNMWKEGKDKDKDKVVTVLN
jgi:hypothetical protein